MPTLVDRLILYRLLFFLLIFGFSSTLVGSVNGWSLLPAFLGVLFPAFAVVLLSIVYLLLVLRFSKLRTSRTFLAVQYVIDALVLTVPIVYSGGTGSTFTSLYVILILISALTHSYRFALTMSLLCCCLVVSISYFEANSLLPGMVRAVENDKLAREILLRNFVYFGLFFVLGLVPARVMAKMRETDESLMDLRRDFALAQEVNRIVVEHVPSGIALLDGSDRLVMLNHSGAAILASIGIKHVAGWFQGLLHLAPTGEVEQDSNRGAVVIGYSIANLGGEVVPGGRIIVFQDVTDRKKIEQRLEAQRRLVSIGQLSAALAHEIRNPLTAISNSTQMLIANVSDHERVDKLTNIQLREIDRMEHLVSDFLRFARPSHATLIRANLRDMIQLSVDRLLLATGAHEEQVHIDCGDDIEVFADSEMFQQAFGNVLLNAQQWADPDSKIRLVVRLTGGEAQVRIHNKGPRIPGEIQEHLFEPFTSARAEGSGLGLAIAWAAANAMGGTLELLQSNDEETIFLLTLNAANDR